MSVAEQRRYGWQLASERGTLVENAVTIDGVEVIRLSFHHRAKAVAEFFSSEAADGFVAIDPAIGKPLPSLTLQDMQDAWLDGIGTRFASEGRTVSWNGMRFLTAANDGQARRLADYLNRVDTEEQNGIIGIEPLPRKAFRLDRWFAADGTRLPVPDPSETAVTDDDAEPGGEPAPR